MDRRDRIRHDRQQQFVELSRERYKPLYRPYELLTRSDREIAQTIIPSRGMTASGPKPAVCQSTKRPFSPAPELPSLALAACCYSVVEVFRKAVAGAKKLSAIPHIRFALCAV